MARNISIDILKVILAFAIIALHGKLFKDINPELSFFLINGFFRIGVPIFLLITGFYFVQVQNFKLWFKRVFYLYLIWMLIYSPFYFASPISLSNITKDFMYFFLGFHHLWYIAGTLLGGGIMWLMKDKSVKLQVLSSVGFFLLGVTLQYLGNMHFFSGILDKLLNIYGVHRNFLTASYPFMMFGYLINKYAIVDKIKYPWVLLIISTGLLFLEVYINYSVISKTESLDGMYSLMLVCPLLFICFFNLNVSGKNKNLALLSTGLYLTHPFIQLSLPSNLNTLQAYAITLVICVPLSFLLISLNKKVKYII